MNYQKEIKAAIDLISISIRTAPKSGGVDDIFCISVNNQLRNKIASKMVSIGREKAKGKPEAKISEATFTSWNTDARVVKNSQGLILVGVRGKKPFGANCGGCGFKSCAEFIAYNMKHKNSGIMGPFCMLKIWDLGMAICSAAKTAAMLNIDNRIMYRIGVAALPLNLFDKKGKAKDILNRACPILGLPLSVSGKNIFFDRLDKLQAAKILTDYYKKK